MILYHFTKLLKMWPDAKAGQNIGIPPDGIRPSVDTYAGSQLSTGPVVWLTADYEASLRPTNFTCVCLQVKIPTIETKLVNWHTFAQKRIGIDRLWDAVESVAHMTANSDCPMSADEFFKLSARWWIYRGTIKSKWVSDLTMVSNATPFWDRSVDHPETGVTR